MDLLEELGKIQQLDDLGLHQAALDTAVSLRRHEDTDPRIWYALKLVIEHQRQKVRERMGSLQKARLALLGERGTA